MTIETQKHPQYAAWEEHIDGQMKVIADISQKAGIPFAATFAVRMDDHGGKMASYVGVSGDGNDPALVKIMDMLIEISGEDGGHELLAQLVPLFETIQEKGIPANVTIQKVGIPDILEQVFSAMEPNPTCDCPRCVAKREAASQVKH